VRKVRPSHPPTPQQLTAPLASGPPPCRSVPPPSAKPTAEPLATTPLIPSERGPDPSRHLTARTPLL